MYRSGRQERAEDTDAQRDRTAVDELARDPRLLRRRRRVDVPDELDELLLRALGAVDESEDPDDERQKRDGGEEELERDRAREEGTFVVREGGGDGARVADECPDGGQDAASLVGAGLSGAFVSDFFSAFVSPVVSPFASDFVSLFLSLFLSLFASLFASLFVSELALAESELFSAGRLSVLYQPDPLKTMAGVEMRRRGFLPQLGHFSSALSLYDWTAENTWPQWSQR
jgi:hypothetical protein